MNLFVNDSLEDLLRSIFKHIIKNGKLITIRDIETIETDPIILELTNSRNRKITISSLNLDLVLVKCLQTVAKDVDIKTIEFYENMSFKKPSAAFIFNDFSTESFMAQVLSIFNSLTLDPLSRQAVIRWPIKSVNPSITNTLQFVIRDDKLNVISSFRSNEMWKGFPTDICFIFFFQELIASWMGLTPGKCTHFVSCPHIYTEHLGLVKLFLSSRSKNEDFIPQILNLKVADTKKEATRLVELEKSNRISAKKLSICTDVLYHSPYFKSISGMNNED